MLPVTNLASYLYCPRKLYLNSVLGIIGFESRESVVGKIKHEVIERINKYESEIVKKIGKDAVEEDIESLYRLRYYRLLLYSISRNKQELKRLKEGKKQIFDEIWPVMMEEARIRSRNVSDFKSASNLYGENLWESLFPKFISEFSLSSQTLGLKGRIDKIKQCPGSLVPLEIKTGKAPRKGIWQNHSIQLAAYIMMLKESNPGLDEGYIEYIDTKEKRKLKLNPFMEEEIKELILKVKSLLNSEELPPKNSNKLKCERCNIKEECFSKG